MIFEWDENKSRLNDEKHGLTFLKAHDFAWDRAVLFNRTRQSDGEQRYAAVGDLHGKLHTIIFTKRGDKFRIISLRRSNKPEEKAYAQQNT
jgi:hypothetical protein